MTEEKKYTKAELLKKPLGKFTVIPAEQVLKERSNAYKYLF